MCSPYRRLCDWRRRDEGSEVGPPSGWESLTPAEARVVELVAEGLTNPEIARRLYVSRDTVKSHVSSALMKLAFRTRAELAASASRRPGPNRSLISPRWGRFASQPESRVVT